MAKISVNPILSLIRCSKRCYTVVAAEKGRLGPAETEVSDVAGKKEKVFWVRDPKTGNWIPENHFGDIDVAEMRNKYLSNTHNNKLITQTTPD